MFHDQHYAASVTPPQQSQLLEMHDLSSNHGGYAPSWTAPSAGGTVVRESTGPAAPPSAAAPPSGTQTPRYGRHHHGRKKRAYKAIRHAFSDWDESDRERRRNQDPEERRRTPHYLSTLQDMVLRGALFFYFWAIVVAIFSLLNNEWALPYALASNVTTSQQLLAVGLYNTGCSLTTDCPGGSDCRSGIGKDVNLAGILIIIGIVALFFSGYCILRIGMYRFFMWHPKKSKPTAWRRKKKYRRSPACLSLVAGVLFLVANIIFMNAAGSKYGCQEALCDSSRCVYGAAYWFIWLVVAISLIGAVCLFFMWRFPPKDFASVWGEVEQEEERRRKEAELEEFGDYSGALGKAAADLDKLISIEVLTRENEHLQSQVQYLSSHAAPPLGGHIPSFRTMDSLSRRAGPIGDPEEVDMMETMETGGDRSQTHEEEEAIRAATPGGASLQNAVRPISPGRDYVVRENQLKAKLKVMEDKWKQEALMRKKLFNELQDSKGKIRVMCRSRPFRPEVEDGQVELKFVDDFTLQVPAKDKEFMFDFVFPPESRQEQVWQQCKGMAQSALDGYNVCIFAYGQTGSGKTYTMQGEDDNPGITPRMAQEVFDVCNKVRTTHSVTVSCYMVELYLEDLNDLLLPADKKKDAPKLEIKSDVNGVVMIKNVTIREATNADDLMKTYLKGCRQRHIRSHAMNDSSSRSHLVFSILIESTNTVTGKVITGKLSLVDLAGSERLKKTRIDATGVEEATAINDSLFELGKVISDLSSENPAQFVNKRNSKLTLIMSDSLGGNAKTLMIVCVSPASFNLAETVNSLEFATRCKKVTNAATKNEETKQIAKLKQQYRGQIEELEAEVARLRGLLGQQ
eukprot:EG_transcript_2274